ncbi:hypothetical protein MHU86_1214 [Fragilaria crotonensis]|nr:hypothetical protein MHU86_1214 [Fragilaria crotonensis]
MVAELRRLVQLDGYRRRSVDKMRRKGVIASTTNGAFDEFGVGVGDSSMIAVARKDADAVKRCTMASQSKNRGAGVWWAINDVFLAGVADVCKDQVVKCGADKWV